MNNFFQRFDFSVFFQKDELKNEQIQLFLVFFMFSFLYFFSVVYSNSFYGDDFVRIYTGEFGWTGLGRPLAAVIAYFYSMNTAVIIDPSPLSYIISMLFLSASSYLIFIKFDQVSNGNGKFFGILFIFNPFFISNFSYRFDGIGMSLGLLSTTLAFSLKNTFRCYALKIFFLLSISRLI